MQKDGSFEAAAGGLAAITYKEIMRSRFRRQGLAQIFGMPIGHVQAARLRRRSNIS